jgi:cell division protease FtsH
MNSLRRLFQLGRNHPGAAAGALVVGLLLAALVALWWQARAETNARKHPQALAFEQAPETWLARATTVAEFVRAVDGNQLAAVGIANGSPGLVLYTLKNGTRAATQVPGCNALGCAGTVLDTLGTRSAAAGFALVGVDVDGRGPSQQALDVAEKALPPVALLLALGGALMLMMRMQTLAGSDAAALSTRPGIDFSDVIGNAEAKAALQRVKAFMHEPAQYARLGAAAPRGVLMVGPPGTGKTLLAKALAGESKANFIAVDGSYFTATYYGAGVAKVKALFRLARRQSPCVLFIDEVDGIGKRAQGGPGGGAESEMNRIINRVLVEMDGFDALDNVVVVAATNHEDNIDEALRRPGRFDMLVRLTKPTLPEREALFGLYLGKVTHDGSSDCGVLARMGAGLSPAEIANVVNKAAANAAEQGAPSVTHTHLVRAVETQLLGGEVSPLKDLLTAGTRERLALHEAGHALVAHWTGAGRVERVTIEPRGPGLGVTHVTRESEDPLYAQGELVGRLAMLLGGREAELMVLGSVSTGASDDLKRASELAIQMVGQLGFSDTFGLLSVAGIPKELMAPDVQGALLKEARTLLNEAQATCRQVLAAQRPRLDAMANALLAAEVLAGEPLRELLGDTGGAVSHREAEAVSLGS